MVEQPVEPRPVAGAVDATVPGLVTVVIPAWNEAETMAELMRRLRAVLDPRVQASEVLVVVPSRYVAGGTAQMPTGRALMSRLLNLIFRRVLAVPVRDLSSGFRIYQRVVLRELELRSEQYDILEEILVQIYTLGWHVAEIPFDYRFRIAGESHASIVGFAPHFLSTLFRLWMLRNSFSSADYDARAYDSIVLPQRYWQRERYAALTEMAGERTPRLDVGCGTSHFIQASPATVGFDLEMSKLRFLRRTNPLLVRGTCFRLPFADASFPCVVSSQVIEHLPYDPGLFRELNRVLEDGGTLVIGTPDYGRVEWRVTEWLYKLLLPNAYGDDHISHYTRASLEKELAESGFAVVGYRYVFRGELIVRCVKRSVAPDASPKGTGSAG
jgi:ubiquinone/menaquinone biosynthesis C-methylase UbiE